MGEEVERPIDEETPHAHDGDSAEDLLERIRRLEKENRQLEERIHRIEGENKIFREILESKGLDPDASLEKQKRYLEERAALIEENKELKRRVNMNSGNSSMPPSSDKPWNRSKDRSLRTQTGKKVGGQVGHSGSTITIPHEADNVIKLYPPGCDGCCRRQECESAGALSCAEKRTVVDIDVMTTVTEYRALRRGPCPSADAEGDMGVFPEGVRAHVQYGNGVAALIGILDSHGAMADKRIAEVINGVSGLSMSPSTVIALTGRCAEMVAPAMGPIADAVAASSVVNCDETAAKAVIEVETQPSSDGQDGVGTEVQTEPVSKNVWIHGASTPLFTCLNLSRIRGYGGMAEVNVITRVKGTIIHDCWAPYWRITGVRHALCNAHILRELNGVIENMPDHRWAPMFVELLIGMKEAKEDAMISGLTSLSADVLEDFHRRYAGILDLADTECPPPSKPSEKRRGKPKKGKERSLIERLRRRETEMCLFAHDFSVSFDNNLAERAFRFVKTKMKVSGCFRSIKGLKQYLDIMSYLDTARKHGTSAFKALSMAFDGQWAAAIGLS